MKDRKRWRRLIGLPLSLGAGLFVALLGAVGALEDLELWSLDLRHRVRGEVALSPQVVVIDVDEETYRTTGWPVPRGLYADLIETAKERGALAMGFDLLFSDPTAHPDQDAQMAVVAERAGLVVFPAELGFAELGGEPAELGRGVDISSGSLSLHIQRTTSAVPPIGQLLAASSRMAHLQLDNRPDGVFRKVPLLLAYDGKTYPSLALATVMTALGLKGLRVDRGELRLSDELLPIPVDETGTALVNFHALNTIEAYPLRGILDARHAAARGEVPPLDLGNIFKRRIVLVGSSAATVGDHGPTPLSNSSPLVLFHANIIDNILTGRFLRPLSPGGDIVLLLVICCLVGLAAGWWRRLVGGLATLGVLLSAMTIAYWAFAVYQIHMEVIAPLAGGALSFIVVGLHNHYVRDADERLIKRAFSRYVSPTILEQIVHRPELLSVRGQKKRLSVLFSDIKGYTALSNIKSTEEIMDLLNEYLDAMVAEVFRHHGTVDKIMGDGLMVFFGDPVPNVNHALDAVRTANAMHGRLHELRQRWTAGSGADIQVRIGIATGEVFVGNIGSKDHLEYTAIGAAVNLASRLEANGRPGQTTICADTYRELGGKIPCSPLRLGLKGFSELVEAWEVTTDGDEPGCDPGNERRAAKRMALLSDVTLEIDGRIRTGRSTDISKAGMFVEMDEPPPVGAPLAVFAMLPVGKSQVPFRLDGIVARLRGAGGEQRAGVGIRLSHVTSESEETLKRVFEIMLDGGAMNATTVESTWDPLGRRLFRAPVSAELETLLEGAVGPQASDGEVDS